MMVFLEAFRLYMVHVMGLGFSDRPDYEYLKGLFKAHAQKENYRDSKSLFDWELGKCDGTN
jgi:hypothetical protein